GWTRSWRSPGRSSSPPRSSSCWPRRRSSRRAEGPVPEGGVKTAFRMARAAGTAMAVTFRNLFRPPVTVHYPRVTRPYPDRFRGLLALPYDPETGEENCIGCRLCEFIRPPPDLTC